MTSLLPGRNVAPLDEQDIRRITNMVLGLESEINFKYEEGTNTKFIISIDDDGNNYGEILVPGYTSFENIISP